MGLVLKLDAGVNELTTRELMAMNRQYMFTRLETVGNFLRDPE